MLPAANIDHCRDVLSWPGNFRLHSQALVLSLLEIHWCSHTGASPRTPTHPFAPRHFTHSKAVLAGCSLAITNVLALAPATVTGTMETRLYSTPWFGPSCYAHSLCTFAHRMEALAQDGFKKLIRKQDELQ